MFVDVRRVGLTWARRPPVFVLVRQRPPAWVQQWVHGSYPDDQLERTAVSRQGLSKMSCVPIRSQTMCASPSFSGSP